MYALCSHVVGAVDVSAVRMCIFSFAPFEVVSQLGCSELGTTIFILIF
jgi:hypothetical protein